MEPWRCARRSSRAGPCGPTIPGETKLKTGYWLAGLAALGAATVAHADSLPMDTPIAINGIQTVCTGVGSGKDDPRWQSYPVRIEFSNGAAQYLAGAHVALSGASGPLTAFDCAGSWVLLQLPAGSYKVTANLTDQPGTQPRSTMFKTSGQGPQKRVEVQFPHMAANQ
jgi:hypothetical protein